MEPLSTESFESWAAFTQSLGLSDAQSRELRNKANGLKDAFAELMTLPGADGATSPLDFLALELQARLTPDIDWSLQGAALHEAYTRFMAYAQRHCSEGATESYAQQFGARSQQVIGEMEDDLDQRQRALFRVSLAPKILEWPTGHDPFGARIAKAVALQGMQPQGEAVRSGDQPEARSSAMSLSPWETIAESGRAEEWSSLALLRRALDLDDAQARKMEAQLNFLKDEVAQLMTLEDGEGRTPAARLAEISMEEGGMDSPAVKGRFMAYLCAQGPGDSTDTYQTHFTRAEHRAHEQLSGLLNPAQEQAFRLVPAGALPEIRTGYDPVGPVVAPYLDALKKAQGAGPSRAAITWPEFCHTLELEAEQATAIRDHLRRLHQEFKVLFDAPGAGEQAAPRAFLRQLLQEGVPEAEAMARFQAYAATTSHHLFQRPYASIFARIESEIRGAVHRVLKKEQEQQLVALGLESLLHVQIEDDGPPAGDDATSFQALLVDAANKLKDEALQLYETPPEGGGPTPLEVLAKATREDSKTAGATFQRYLATRCPMGSTESYGRRLQALDREACNRALAKTPQKERSQGEKSVPPLLLTLDTGYNPLLASLRALLATAD